MRAQMKSPQTRMLIYKLFSGPYVATEVISELLSSGLLTTNEKLGSARQQICIHCPVDINAAP